MVSMVTVSLALPEDADGSWVYQSRHVRMWSIIVMDDPPQTRNPFPNLYLEKKGGKRQTDLIASMPAGLVDSTFYFWKRVLHKTDFTLGV